MATRKAPKTPKIHPASKLLRQAEIATATGMPLNRIRQWQFRGYLPEPDYLVWDTPAWKPETIQPFIQRCIETGSGVNASADK